MFASRFSLFVLVAVLGAIMVLCVSVAHAQYPIKSQAGVCTVSTANQLNSGLTVLDFIRKGRKNLRALALFIDHRSPAAQGSSGQICVQRRLSDAIESGTVYAYGGNNEHGQTQSSTT
ncbi:hypothetical protein BT96DRAFT_978487 [Gymnopus androsaceus JB14]|uniref:Uncharacterized protein n=1 Tax=Gymnopus androsaceus JB14 TaxID=1447944 RepID=A0A6A4HA91_9AGAR|nr:hypothetical protein BT96DRAFT_978487 [Gymnopus androsaceus JB14]